MGAENQIHKTVAFAYLFNRTILLHHAAAQSHLHARPLFLQAVDIAQPPIDSLIRIIPDGAGVIDVKVTVFLFCQRVSGQFQDPGQLFRVPCIHLAAKGGHAGCKRPA